MQIISRKNLRAYVQKHSSTKAALTYWEKVAGASDWQSPADVVRAFPKAHVINGERIRFEIESNVHRMVCSFYFPHRVVFIKFLGTHKQYDQISDITTVSMF